MTTGMMGGGGGGGGAESTCSDGDGKPCFVNSCLKQPQMTLNFVFVVMVHLPIMKMYYNMQFFPLLATISTITLASLHGRH